MYNIIHFENLTLSQQQRKWRPNKLRWSEVNDDDGVGVNLEYLLPPSKVIGSNEDGIKKVIEYKLDGHGNKVRVTTTTRVRKLATDRLSARTVERRSWARFGAAASPWSPPKISFLRDAMLLVHSPFFNLWLNYTLYLVFLPKSHFIPYISYPNVGQFLTLLAISSISWSIKNTRGRKSQINI